MIPQSFLNKSLLTLALLLLVLVIYYLINIGNKFISPGKRIELKDKRILKVVIGLFFVFSFFYLLKKYPILSDTFYTIILSVILAYLFNPIINYFEKKNIKRIYGVIILYLMILGVVLILAFIVVPRSSREIKKLATDMPKYIKNISNFIDELSNRYYSTIGGLPPLFQGVQEVVRENIAGLETIVVNGLKSFFTGLINTFTKLISLILTPILTFYFLADKDYFIKKTKKLIPVKHKEKSLELFRKIDVALSKFVRGKIILAIFVGVTITIALLIIGVDFAVFIGIITALADVIPYIGPFLGFVPAVFFAFLSSPIKALWVSILFVTIQWVENNILAPKIIGDTTGIHPMLVLLSIIVGGAIFGVVGMILSVPVVAVIIILVDFFLAEFKKTKTN
ncbi:MAG TPA: AI-2E family transporter [Tissierellaceae bacterium]|nr:AI-2E family transporter [Tissierellaceae bacterium]